MKWDITLTLTWDDHWVRMMKEVNNYVPGLGWLNIFGTAIKIDVECFCPMSDTNACDASKEFESYEEWYEMLKRIVVLDTNVKSRVGETGRLHGWYWTEGSDGTYELWNKIAAETVADAIAAFGED